MFPLKKCCYVLQLKKGIIILGIIDLILLELLDSVEILAALGNVLIWILILALGTIHSIGCILLFVSVCVLKKSLVICYLVTETIRMLEIVVSCVLKFIDGKIIFGVINIFFIILVIYFLICAYSWYIELRDSEIKV